MEILIDDLLEFLVNEEFFNLGSQNPAWSSRSIGGNALLSGGAQFQPTMMTAPGQFYSFPGYYV